MSVQNTERVSILETEKAHSPIYTNGMQIKMGLYDATIRFLRDYNPINSDEVEQEIVAEIKMSPQLAKVMTKFLNGHVEQYEAQFGKIPDLPEIES